MERSIRVLRKEIMTHVQQRLNEVRRLMEEKNLPALLVSQAENRRYLSGFTGDAGTLLITPQRAILSTDFRYWEQAEKQAPTFEIQRGKGRVQDMLMGLIEAAGRPTRIAFESNTVTVAQLDEMQSALPDIEWIKTSGLVEQVRRVKDATEIALLQKAIALAEEGYAYLLKVIKPGMTERQAAWELEAYLRTHGADGLGFDTIIASGPNGAMAHHEPGERALREGEPIIIDWGARLDGYRSDMTRTIVFGEPDAKFREIYDIVLRAEETAIRQIKAGMTGQAADALARDIIVASGYGEQFGHSLGHGVGLATHEGPRVSYLAVEEILPVGAVVTIEPGIYLPDWGGVRIEDMVVLEEGGARVLTHFEK
jgi:Xaa-Pro aminopeptidase